MATEKSFQKSHFLLYLLLVKSKLWFTSIWVWAIFGRSHWMLSRWLSCRLNYFLFFILVNLNLCRVRNLRNRRLHLFSHLVLARRRHVARRTAGVASWRRQVWRARRIRPRFILFILIKWPYANFTLFLKREFAQWGSIPCTLYCLIDSLSRISAQISSI